MLGLDKEAKGAASVKKGDKIFDRLKVLKKSICRRTGDHS